MRSRARAAALDRAHRRQLLRYHGFAAVRDGATARDKRGVAVRLSAALDRSVHARHPDQLGAAGDPRRRRRERRGAGAAHRARARARPGRQHLPRQGRARAARHADRRSSTSASSAPPSCTWPTCTAAAATARGDHGHGARRAAADRAPGLRGPDADGAGHQGPDRHQGRAAVDADQHRRPAARVPAAGRPHRHLAEDRLARAARAAARAHAACCVGSPRTAAAAASSCAPTPKRRPTPSWPTTSPTCARPGPRSASAPSSRRPARCCTRT